VQVQQFRYYQAEIRVKDRSTLKINLKDGELIKVHPVDIIDGQWAFTSYLDYWIPEEDLIIKREISFEEFNS